MGAATNAALDGVLQQELRDLGVGPREVGGEYGLRFWGFLGGWRRRLGSLDGAERTKLQ